MPFELFKFSATKRWTWCSRMRCQVMLIMRGCTWCGLATLWQLINGFWEKWRPTPHHTHTTSFVWIFPVVLNGGRIPSQFGAIKFKPPKEAGDGTTKRPRLYEARRFLVPTLRAVRAGCYNSVYEVRRISLVYTCILGGWGGTGSTIALLGPWRH